MIFTEKDKEAVRKFIQIKNRGYFVNSNTLQEVYNRVLEKNLSPTNCSSCLRARVSELEKALRQWEADEAKKAASGAATEEEPQDNERGARGEAERVPSEINKTKKRGRPKKNNKEE